MSDPKRVLSDSAASDFQRSLIGAWDDERPPPGAREKTLAALGLSAAVTTTVATTTVAAASTTSAATGSVAPKAIAGGIAWMKWSAVAAVVVGIGGGAAGWVVHLHRPAAHVPVPSTTSSQLESQAPEALVSASPLTSASPPIETVTPVTSATTRARTATARPSASSLSEQLSALDRARIALESGDSAGAERLIRDYETRYPNGAFLQEAEFLRIEATLRRGNRATAERLAARFLAKYPTSPHAARLQTLLDAERDPP